MWHVPLKRLSRPALYETTLRASKYFFDTGFGLVGALKILLKLSKKTTKSLKLSSNILLSVFLCGITVYFNDFFIDLFLIFCSPCAYIFIDVMIEFQEQIPPLRIPASSSSINPKILPPDPFLQNICKRVKNLQLSEVEPDLVPTQEFVREQPDGRDDSQNEATFLLSSAVLNASTVVETSANTASNPHGTDLRPQDAKTGVNSRPVHRNDVTMNYEPLRNGFTSTATDVSLSSKSTTKAKPKDVVSKDNAAARLPAFKPALLRKSPGPDKYGRLLHYGQWCSFKVE